MSKAQKTFNDKLKKHFHATFFEVYYGPLTSCLATFLYQVLSFFLLFAHMSDERGHSTLGPREEKYL